MKLPPLSGLANNRTFGKKLNKHSMKRVSRNSNEIQFIVLCPAQMLLDPLREKITPTHVEKTLIAHNTEMRDSRERKMNVISD